MLLDKEEIEEIYNTIECYQEELSELVDGPKRSSELGFDNETIQDLINSGLVRSTRTGDGEAYRATSYIETYEEVDGKEDFISEVLKADREAADTFADGEEDWLE